MRLGGKTAIVTGGASGFGAGMVRKFLAEGARVMIADLNTDAAQEMAAECGADAMAQTVDVSDGASVDTMIQAAISEWGQVDILVNNAGITHLPSQMEDVSEADFDRVVAVNMKSVYLTARALVPQMKNPPGRGHFECRINGWRFSAPQTELVQCLQGLDDHGDQGNGGGTGPLWHPGQRAEPRRRGNALC